MNSREGGGGGGVQPPSYVNVATAKITLAPATQVIYELSLVNDFHTLLYMVPSLLSLRTVKMKIHRINALENIVVIKSLASSFAPPKTFPLFTQISTINLQERTRCFNLLPPTGTTTGICSARLHLEAAG